MVGTELALYTNDNTNSMMDTKEEESIMDNARKELVVIGNGMAGAATVEEILKLDPDRYNISIFG